MGTKLHETIAPLPAVRTERERRAVLRIGGSRQEERRPFAIHQAQRGTGIEVSQQIAQVQIAGGLVWCIFAGDRGSAAKQRAFCGPGPLNPGLQLEPNRQPATLECVRHRQSGAKQLDGVSNGMPRSELAPVGGMDRSITKNAGAGVGPERRAEFAHVGFDYRGKIEAAPDRAKDHSHLDDSGAARERVAERAGKRVAPLRVAQRTPVTRVPQRAFAVVDQYVRFGGRQMVGVRFMISEGVVPCAM